MRVLALLGAAALATAAAVRGGGLAATSSVTNAFSLAFSSADPTLLPQQVQEVAAANAPLFTVAFGDYAPGPIGENDELLAALRCAGFDAIEYYGGNAFSGSSHVELDSSFVTSNLLCPVGVNMASVLEPGAFPINANRNGRFYLRLSKPVKQLFVELGATPVGVQFSVQLGSEPVGATLRHGATYEMPVLNSDLETDNGAGMFALVAAQDGGEFDRVYITGGSRAAESDDWPLCIKSVAAPARDIGRRSGCSSFGLPDDDRRRRKRDVGELVAAQRKRAAASSHRPPATIDVAVDSRQTLPRHDSPCGRLCATMFDTYDEGYVFAQQPSRLDSDKLLKYISYRGNVLDEDQENNNIDEFKERREEYFKAFCALARDTGGVVQDNNGGSDEAVVPADGGVYRIELHGKHRTLLVDTNGEPFNLKVRVALDDEYGGEQDLTRVPHWTNVDSVAGGPHATEFEDGGGVLTINAADADGVFNIVEIIQNESTGARPDNGGSIDSELCITAIAACCDEL